MGGVASLGHTLKASYRSQRFQGHTVTGMTSAGTAETANTWSMATLGQCHPVCPTTRTDQANHSHPSKASEHTAARHLSGVAPCSISLASFPGAPLMRGAHGTPTLPPSVATRNTALFSPHHPSLWGPRTGRSVRPEGTHNLMPAGEQGHVRSASQGMGGLQDKKRVRDPGHGGRDPPPQHPAHITGLLGSGGDQQDKEPEQQPPRGAPAGREEESKRLPTLPPAPGCPPSGSPRPNR